MKSKIVSLSKNKDFKSLLGGKKRSSKYFTLFFKKLNNKNSKNLNKNILQKKNYAYLMIARSQTYKEKFSIISEQVNKTFEKIKRIIN